MLRLSIRSLSEPLKVRPPFLTSAIGFHSTALVNEGKKKKDGNNSDELISQLESKAKAMDIDPQVLRDAAKLLSNPVGTATKEPPKEHKQLKQTHPPKVEEVRKPPKGWRKMELPEWKRHRYALWEKQNGEYWNPGKKVSRDQMDSIRLLKKSLPHLTASDLAKEYHISPEAVSKILKSKWKPNEQEEQRIQDRWLSRRARLSEIRGAKRTSQMKTIIKTGYGVERATPDYLRKNEKIKKGKQPGSLKRLFKLDVDERKKF